MTELDYNKVLRDVATEERLTRNWQAISQRQYSSGRPIVWVAAIISVGVIAAMAIFFFTKQSETGLFREEAGKQILVRKFARLSVVQQIVLSDGSKIYMEKNSHLELGENTGKRFVTILREGRVRFDVKPNGPRKWVVEAGLGRVEVLGTSFTLKRTDGRLDVAVHRGKVLLRGPYVPEYVQQLTAGESITLTAASRVVDTESAGAPIQATDTDSATSLEREREAISSGTMNAEKSSRNEQPRRESIETIPSNGVPSVDEKDAQMVDAPVKLLLRQADEARRVGDSRRALELLDQVVSDYATDPASGLAAFTMGRIQLHDIRAYRAAANSFDMAIQRGVPSGLREQAYAKKVEALHQAGDRPALAGAAKAYMDAFPKGAWREMVEYWADSD